MSSKFKEGEKVTVKMGLVVDKFYDGMNLVEEMKAREGTQVTIKFATNSGFYRIVEDYGQFGWTDSMFKPKPILKDIVKAVRRKRNEKV